MGKAQSWVGLLLLAAISLQIVADVEAAQLAKSGHPIKAVKQINPKLLLYLIGGFVGLVLLADVAPDLAVGIAALLFIGSLLSVGPQGITGAK